MPPKDFRLRRSSLANVIGRRHSASYPFLISLSDYMLPVPCLAGAASASVTATSAGAVAGSSGPTRVPSLIAPASLTGPASFTRHHQLYQAHELDHARV